MPQFVPSLHVLETRGRVRITMPGITYGSGQTLQDAADDLVRKVLVIAMTCRSDGIAPAGPELRVDPAIHDFIWELAGIAARGDDIRSRLFGPRLMV
ncbi:MAG TPA: hypothetical protein VMS64_20970 [Candidatus Methylomirabilis sp.]|nr:hypothetical protein [Candidatus Methylomirabilis sp.]